MIEDLFNTSLCRCLPENLWKYLNEIYSSTNENIWYRNKQYFIHYTDHTPERHSRNIIENINLLTQLLMDTAHRLLPHETFILLASALLHDIGMQFITPETLKSLNIDKTFIDRVSFEDFEKIRKMHGKLAGMIIERSVLLKETYPDLGLKDDEYLLPIKSLCEGHTNTNWIKYQEERGIGGNLIVREQFLIALLRFADFLDITHTRINFEELKRIEEMLPIESVVHWYSHYYTQNVNIHSKSDDGSIQLELEFVFPAKYKSSEIEEFFFESIMRKLKKELREINPYLSKFIKILLKQPEIRYTDGKKPLLQQHENLIKKSGESFSKALNIEGPRYNKINELYVKPVQYEEIKDALTNNHIVCITGDPGMGKSYTALHLLYELFLEGYIVEKPDPRESEEVVTELMRNPKKLERKAIYIEDPFGKSDYTRFVVPLANNFETLVSILKNRDTRIILTSRSGLFEKGIGRDFHETESMKKIRFYFTVDERRSSYKIEDIENIIKNYSKLYNAGWYGKTEIETPLYQKLAELQVPLYIEVFIATYFEEENIDLLLTKIEEDKQKNQKEFFRGVIQSSSPYEIAGSFSLCMGNVFYWWCINASRIHTNPQRY